jgi:hypothetical protein
LAWQSDRRRHRTCSRAVVVRRLHVTPRPEESRWMLEHPWVRPDGWEAELALDHQHLLGRRLPQQPGHPQARRRVVLHSGVPRGSWLLPPDRRLSRTSQRLQCPSAPVPRRTRDRPDRPAGRSGGRGHAGRLLEVPVEGRSHELPGRGMGRPSLPLLTARAGRPERCENGAVPWHGRTTDRSRTRWPDHCR